MSRRLCVRDALDTGRLVEIVPEWSRGLLNILAVYPSRRHVPQKITAFLEFLIQAFGLVEPPRQADDEPGSPQASQSYAGTGNT